MSRRHNIIAAIAAVSAIVAAVAIWYVVWNVDNECIPRRRAFMRIEPYAADYSAYDSLPLQLQVNSSAKVLEADDASTPEGSHWINISYPRFGSTVYCTYVDVTPASLDRHLRNRYERIEKNVRGTMRNVLFADSITGISSDVFFAAEGNVVPLQFISTDSATFVFSGAVFIPTAANADSVAPIVDNISDDVMYMLQNLKPKAKQR